MERASITVERDQKSGGIVLYGHPIHPLWLRERVSEAESFDPHNHQRLYEHAELAPDITVTNFEVHSDRLVANFSDGYEGQFDVIALLGEVESATRDRRPQPKPWTGGLDFTRFDWSSLDDSDVMMGMLAAYFENAFCIMDNVPTDPDSLKSHARRFGFLRETNFGELFNVETKRDPSDMAYTDAALASHTDNPYRDPVPGIQFLHCLKNDVEGGLSTLVDGMAVAEAIGDENPKGLHALETTPVRFRYQGPTGIYESVGPLIARDHQGVIHHIRFSSRVDYVPALHPDRLEIFYAARRRMHALANDPAFQIRFPFRPGTLLMMNNYRLFHGRTAYDGGSGHRHLQGCYIDHDGPQCLYRMLASGDKRTHVLRES